MALLPSPLHRSHLVQARHWAAVHLRRHTPFALYTAATAAGMAWTAWMLAHL